MPPLSFSYMKRNDYQQALLLLEKIAGLPNKEGLPHIVSMHLIVLKGICLESLGRYEDAAALSVMQSRHTKTLLASTPKSCSIIWPTVPITPVKWT